jgi:hypothetical protein
MAFDLAQTVLMTVLALGQPAAGSSDGKDCGCKKAELPIHVAIERDRVSVLHQAPAACCGATKAPGDAFMVSCRELKSEVTSAGGRTVVKLVCTDAEFSTGEGLQGQAAQLVYDSSTGGLELRGTDERQVRLWWKSPAENDLHLAAPGMRLDLRNRRVDLQESPFRMLGLGSLVQPASGCYCGPDCVCAEGGCCSKRPIECLPADGQPAPLPAADAGARRLFNFSVGFTR